MTAINTQGLFDVESSVRTLQRDYFAYPSALRSRDGGWAGRLQKAHKYYCSYLWRAVGARTSCSAGPTNVRRRNDDRPQVLDDGLCCEHSQSLDERLAQR